MDNSTAIYVEEGNPGGLPGLVSNYVLNVSCTARERMEARRTHKAIAFNKLNKISQHPTQTLDSSFLLSLYLFLSHTHTQYSGTNAEFTKADTVIFRTDLYNTSAKRLEYKFKRTLKYDSKWLDSK